MNQRDEKIINAMRGYDSAPIGSPERASLGETIEKLGSKISERDYVRIVYEYERGNQQVK